MVYVIGSVIRFAIMYAIGFATCLDAIEFARQYAALCAIGFAELDEG